VEVQNPYNEKEFLDDKLTVVDVKVRDAARRQFQVEIQLLNHRDLLARILYGWADLYSQQIKEGQPYRMLRPTYAIWLLGQTLLPKTPGYAHNFCFRDPQGLVLLDHGGIWILELSKLDVDPVETEQERWLKFFFKEAERLDDGALPVWMQTREMRQAMSTLKMFSEKEHAYHAYQARQNFLRVQQSIQMELDDLRAEAECERAEAEQERVAKEQALAAKDLALAAEAQARAAEERERTAKEDALAEVERLKRLLAGQTDTTATG